MSGGAGIAARRICQAQTEFGLNASLLGGQISEKKWLVDNEEIIERLPRQKIESSLVTFLQRSLVQQDEYLTTPISINTIDLQDPRIQDADVINIHAYYNLLSNQKIAQLAKNKRVIVTMHDQRFFTGGCHYSLECNQYETLCTKCPQVRKSARTIVRIAHINEIANREAFEAISYVTPSKWLKDLAAKSSLLRNSRIEVINNPIPSKFKKMPGMTNPELFTVGFVSENLNNPYKGISTLIEAINIVSKNRKISLLLFGSGKVSGLDPRVELKYSRFDSDSQSAMAFNKCNLIVLPSIQDNSPSVLSESLMCGIPVIASQVGGITEILSQFGLPGFPPGDFEKLAELMDSLASMRPEFPLLANAGKFLSYSAGAAKYKAVYESALSQ
jgi:glycosyltransferase involved in cell wall biosynthesis